MHSLITLGKPVGELLKESAQTLAVCESSIAGLLSAALVSVPGHRPISSVAPWYTPWKLDASFSR